LKLSGYTGTKYRKLRCWRFTSAQFPAEKELVVPFHVVRIRRSPSGSANGSGRNSTL
jgi:hypothetical protein